MCLLNCKFTVVTQTGFRHWIGLNYCWYDLLRLESVFKSFANDSKNEIFLLFFFFYYLTVRDTNESYLNKKKSIVIVVILVIIKKLHTSYMISICFWNAFKPFYKIIILHFINYTNILFLFLFFRCTRI